MKTVDFTPGTAEPLFSAPPPGSAEPQLGAGHLGWYTRGYLPHHDAADLRQTITYHLADSLPATAATRIQAELAALPLEQQDVERRKRLDDWLDAGHGSCILRHPDAAACIVDTWQRFARERYDLLAWVVMPNHVHLLIRVYPGAALGKIVKSWKSFTGRKIRELQESQATRRAGARRSQEMSTSARCWMREYWDRTIRYERHFQAALNYIHANPVKAGLVSLPEDWEWSSARPVNLAELGLGDPRKAGPSLC